MIKILAMKQVAHKIKILHVEDQEHDAEQVARLLRKSDIQIVVNVVDSRIKYEDALYNFSPDIIISDHHLPQFNSIEAMEVLKKSGLKIPFILVTGTVSEEFAVEAMRAGADDYILKDRPHRLPIAVLNTLEKYKLQRENEKTQLLLRNIDSNSLDMICSIDEEGKFSHVSAASESIFGYAPSELLGQKYIDMVFDDDVEDTLHVANSIMAANPVTAFENRYRHKNGKIVPVLWSARWEDSHKTMYCIAKDATELKKAEKALAAERKRLYDLFMNAPVSMCILKGKDHVFELANPDYLKIGGKQGMNIIGKTGGEVFPELVDQGLITLLDSIYESGEPFKMNEMAMEIDRENNGQLSCIYQNILEQPYRDVEGNVAGIFYFGVDVTEQVLARKKIEESEQRYRQIVETAQEGIWLVDEHNKTTFVNNKLCELLEYKPEEMIGKDIYFFMDDQQKQMASESMQRRREGKSGKAHFKYLSKTKREIWANVSANPLFDELGTYRGSLAMITDITEQKKIGEENRKLAYVASLTVNAVIVTDAEGRITWVNQGFERITEYTFDEVKGKRPGDFLQGKETDSATIELMRESRKENRGFRVEVINYSKSGRKYCLDIEVVPLLDDYNQLTGFMAIEQDITERKRSEQETLNLITNLQVKNKDLQQFSYIVSHNLRAPVAKILGLTNIIGDDPDEDKALIQLITEAASDLDEVVKDINVIVSSRRSDHEKRVKAFFERKLQQIIQVLEKEITESGATITWDFSEVTQVETIKSYLYSIVYNLVSNAIKYRLPDVPLVVKLRTTQNNEFVCLSVEDNGTGIDLQKNGAKIFGLYKRFNGDAIPGKGVGLNLVKSHAESLGGRVEVESKLNQGSIFKVYLPKSYGTPASE